MSQERACPKHLIGMSQERACPKHFIGMSRERACPKHFEGRVPRARLAHELCMEAARVTFVSRHLPYTMCMHPRTFFFRTRGLS